MIWVFGYLTAGALSGLFALVRNYDDLRQKFAFGKLAFAAFAVVAIFVLWPLFVVPAIYDSVVQRLRDRPKPAFKIVPRDLGQALSIEAVEARERVEDPLGAVPALPFGHLNPAWVQFKAGLAPGSQLSPFSKVHKDGIKERYVGYAEVGNDPVTRWFFTGIRRI